jgi:hypothetical protein
MTAKTIFRLPVAGLACAMISSGSLRAAPINVTDLKGRAIDIELVSVAGDSVTFRRAGREFTLPIGNFDAPSQDSIRNEAARIPVAVPKIQPEIVIGKRRKKDDSFYMVKQEITCTVKLGNPSNAVAVPPVNGKIVFIGQDRRTPDLFQVLSSQAVETSIKPGETFVKEMEPFITTYDSDNKGVGNVGGSQYVGYVLVMLNEAGEVVLDDTKTAGFRQAISDKPSLLKEIISYPKGKVLTKNLEPAAVVGNVRVRP